MGKSARRESRPTLFGVVQRVIDDGDSVSKAVNARTFVGLNLKELENAHRLARGGHELQLPSGRGEHHACRIDVQRLDASIAQYGQDVNNVVVVHQVVREFNECCDQERFSGHGLTYLFTADQNGIQSSKPAGTRFYFSASVASGSFSHVPDSDSKRVSRETTRSTIQSVNEWTLC